LAKVGQAADNFIGSWVSILRGAAFEHITDIYVTSLHTTGPDNAFKQLACTAYKGSALDIFIRSRGLPHKYKACLGITFPWDGILTRGAKVTFATLFYLDGQFMERFVYRRAG
jgi:hypothetical protein